MFIIPKVSQYTLLEMSGTITFGETRYLAFEKKKKVNSVDSDVTARYTFFHRYLIWTESV